MTLDSSALIAILFAEPNYLDLVDRVLEAGSARVGAPTLVETSMVFSARRGSGTGREVDDLVKELGITVVPFGEAEWHAATAAFHKYRPRPAPRFAELRRLPCVRDGVGGGRFPAVRA